MSTDGENDAAIAAALAEEDSFRDERNWPPPSEEEIVETAAVLSLYAAGNSETQGGAWRSAGSIDSLDDFGTLSIRDSSSRVTGQRRRPPVTELRTYPICTEQMMWNEDNNAPIPCEHCDEHFHAKCLVLWFGEENSRDTCPVCRQKF
jgi:hypothetical protein